MGLSARDALLKSCGHDLPKFENVADFCLDVAEDGDRIADACAVRQFATQRDVKLSRKQTIIIPGTERHLEAAGRAASRTRAIRS